ncbi:MAG: NERD domain-containing protein [Eubacterium sp.]|nr:NERD domain-containing protein [Eubacterium sp.]
MLERIAIVLLIVNICIFGFIKLLNKGAAPMNARGRVNTPASVPYDVHDFCAYHSHIVLRPFEEGGARFIFDCDLPNCDEPIDMIMLAKSGVYVFEHVKAEGWISGIESNETWNERIQFGYGRAPHEEKFDNPVTIVEDKVQRLRAFLDNEGIIVRSVVVFPDFCVLNNIKVFNPNVRVVVLNQLLPTVVKMNNRMGTVLTQRDINELYDYLIQFEIVPEEDEFT